MIALIDGDSIAFMLGWHHKDHQDIPTMHQAVDKFLEDMFILTGADMYYGALATPQKCFRYQTYKVKPYKGIRPELSEHMEFWRPVVNKYLQKQWQFDLAFHSKCDPSFPDYLSMTDSILEADDLVNSCSLSLKNQKVEHVICSPDKDLKQIPGLHYDYKKNEFCTIDEHQANYNFFTLMLEGDTTDGVCGIPGFGPKKRQEKLKPLLEAQANRISYEELVKGLYHKHFGYYYGDIIYKETEQTISLVWDQERKIQVHSVPQKKEIHPFDQLSGGN